MKKFWKKQLPAVLLALVMTIGMMPAAMATGETDDPSGDNPGTVTPGEGETPTPPVHTHTPESVWSSDASGHWHECIDNSCGEKLEFAAHSPSSWSSVDNATHEKKCTVCGYVIETRAHSISETVSKIEPATCYQDGKEYYACTDGCGYSEEKTIPATGKHVESGTWESDNSYHWHPCTTAGCKYDGFGKAAHTFTSGEYVTSSTQHWQVCTICGGTSAKASHTPDSTGKCTVCKQQVSNAIYSVTFYYVSSNGRTYTTQNTNTNGYVSAPAISSKITYGGKTYTFVGWTQSYTSDHIYSRQYLETPSSIRITNNSYVFYALYTTDDDSTITYTVDAGKSEDFDSSDFEKAYKDQYSGYLKYVTFSVNSSTYTGFSGSIYSGSTELTRSTLVNNEFYTEDYAGKNDYELDDLSLVAPKGAKDDSISISFTAVGTKGSVSGTLKLVVGDDEAGDTTIVYEVTPGKTVDFSRTDFNKVYQTEYSGNFSYVEFDKPGTTAFSEGTLYSGYSSSSKYTEKFTRTNLSSYSFYYNSASGSNSYNLNTLTFVADSDFEDTVKLTFRVYGSSSKYVDGTVEIRSTDSASDGDITYTVAPGKEVTFDEDDFQAVYRKEYSTGTIKWVEFTAPTSLTSAGTVYYDYGYNSQKSFNRSSLNSTKFYYGTSSSSGDYALDDLSFVASSSFSSSVSISFRAYSSSSKYVDGTLVLKSSSSSTSGDITYKAAPGKQVVFDEDDFQTVYRKKETGTIRWVEFTAPASLSAAGTVYYDYGYSSQKSFTRSSLNSTKFYYGTSSNYGDYALDDLSFVASSSFSTAVSVDFRAYYNDSKYVDGTLVLQPDTAAAAASGYVGSIRYTTTTGTRVQINANDIARYFKKNAGTTMQYVMLTGVPATGGLYYNYYNTSKYGTTTRAQITSSNAGGQAFYASPANTSQFALTELTYVPSGTNYCASIPFTAYGGSRSVTGAILISVNGSAVAEVYGVTPKNTPVVFPASSISSAVVKATGTAPASIQLLSLPSYTAGAVYVGTSGTTAANTTTAYSIFSGAQTLRFVPTSSYTGSVEIPYVALSSNGTAIASGTFSLGVLNSKKEFSDVKTSTWCYKYVAELSDAGVIDGYTNGTFKPDSTVTYGAALKLIMLAAGYPEQKPTNSNVFSGYLAKAREDGIITVSTVNLSKPITRLQVAQIAAGAMKLDTTNLSSVKPFTDTTNAAVQALNAAGIVEGYFSNGTSTFKPNNTLTRGQVSAIVWRMRNYNK